MTAPRPDIVALVRFLNDMIRLDHAAMKALINQRVSCNKAMADHPSVQVAAPGVHGMFAAIPPGEYRLGIVGLLNGYVGDDGSPYWIVAVYDRSVEDDYENAELVRFDLVEWKGD